MSNTGMENSRFQTRGEKTNREILERLIRQNPGASKGEIESLATAAGMTRKSTRALLDEGVREGWLIPDVGRRGRRSYRLAEIEVGVF